MLYDRIEFAPNRPLKLRVVDVADYPFHMHKNVLEIIFTLEGMFELTVVNNIIRMSTGDIYISSPNELHRLRSYQDTSHSLILLIHIDLNAYKAVFPQIDTYQFANSALEKNRAGMEILGSYLKKQLHRLLTPSDAEEAGFYEVGEKILRILIGEFQCYYLGKGYPEFNRIYLDNEVQLNRIRRIIDYIYKNYDKPIKIEDVAEMEHISPYHLTHIMKNGSGASFRTFLNMARVEKSATLLLENEKSLQAIACECGFSKYRYFSESFERVFRMTPQQYRQAYCGHTIAVRRGSERTLGGPELERFLKKYCGREEEVRLDLNKDYPPALFCRFKCVNLAGERYNHITDLPLLRQLRESLSLEMLGIDSAFLRPYRNSPRTLAYIVSDFQRSRLGLRFYVGQRQTIAELKADLELLKGAGCGAAGERVEFYIPPQQDEARARQLKKLAASYGFFVYITDKGRGAGGNPIHRSGYMPCFLLHTIRKKQLSYANQVALCNGQDTDGGIPLVTERGVWTPVYHLLSLMGQMGDTLIAQGDMYFITQGAEKQAFQILTYSYDDCFDALFEDPSKAQEHASFIELIARDCDSSRTVRLSIHNISGNYVLRRYQLTAEDFQSKYRDSALFSCGELSRETLRVLNDSLAPKPSLSLLELNGSYDVEFKLNPFEIMLFSFEKL